MARDSDLVARAKLLVDARHVAIDVAILSLSPSHSLSQVHLRRSGQRELRTLSAFSAVIDMVYLEPGRRHVCWLLRIRVCHEGFHLLTRTLSQALGRI